MKLKLTIILCAFSLLSFSQTKELVDIKAVQELTKEISSSFLKLDFETTFEKMKPHWALSTSEIDSLRIKTESFAPFFRENFGKAIDAVKLKEVNLKNVLYKEVYAIRFEKYALRMVMKFNNLNNKWAIVTFEWDDRIQDELD